MNLDKEFEKYKKESRRTLIFVGITITILKVLYVAAIMAIIIYVVYFMINML
jgi:hypothetical protein